MRSQSLAAIFSSNSTNLDVSLSILDCCTVTSSLPAIHWDYSNLQKFLKTYQTTITCSSTNHRVKGICCLQLAYRNAPRYVDCASWTETGTTNQDKGNMKRDLPSLVCCSSETCCFKRDASPSAALSLARHQSRCLHHFRLSRYSHYSWSLYASGIMLEVENSFFLDELTAEGWYSATLCFTLHIPLLFALQDQHWSILVHSHVKRQLLDHNLLGKVASERTIVKEDFQAYKSCADLDQSYLEMGCSVVLAKASISSIDLAGGVLYPAPPDPLERCLLPGKKYVVWCSSFDKMAPLCLSITEAQWQQH